METGKINLKVMEMLDKGNTGAFGTPKPATVPLTIEKGPFIVISGHDLHDLEMLLEQTDGKGINVYTHGEMLPAHAYPELTLQTQRLPPVVYTIPGFDRVFQFVFLMSAGWFPGIPPSCRCFQGLPRYPLTAVTSTGHNSPVSAHTPKR
jgi:hypothetical protein